MAKLTLTINGVTVANPSNDSKVPTRRQRPKEGRSLAEMRPDIAREWHPTLNEGATPYDYSYGSGAKVWWICAKGHAYDMTIHSRTSKHGGNCPICLGRRILVGYNDLQTINPELASQWHPMKNGDLKATDVTKGSGKKVWWMCAIGHEWIAKVADRAVGGNGCPLCMRGSHESFSEKAVAYYLKRHFPDLKTNCHPGELDLGKSEVDIWIPSIRTAVEYDGGRWHANVQSDVEKDRVCTDSGISVIRVRDEKCPEYKGTAIVVDRKSDTGFATLDAAIRKLFLAMGLDDSDIDSQRDSAEIYKMHGDGRIENSLATRRPNIAKEWHPTKNGSLTPEMVYPRSGRTAWWICPNGHEYEATIANRSAGHGCWQCRNELISKQRKTPKDGMSLMDECPNISSEWVMCNDDESKTPYDVGRGSRAKVTWKCSYCGSTFSQEIYRRTRYGDRFGCGSCRISMSRRQPKLGESLQERFPDVASEWHPTKNGNLTPDMIKPKSDKVVWWLGKCGHEWDATVSNRTRKTGGGCPICSGQRVLIGYNDLATVHPELVEEWDFSKNVEFKITDVTSGSNKRAWWKCSKCGNEWQAVISSRSSGCGCPECRNEKISIAKKLSWAKKAPRDNRDLETVWHYAPMHVL